MQSLKSVDLIGHINILSWWQLNGCGVTRPFSLCEGCGLQDYNYNMIKQSVDLSLDYLWLKGKKPGFPVGSRDEWSDTDTSTYSIGGWFLKIQYDS